VLSKPYEDMAKLKSKGTALAVSVAEVYTAISQIIDMDKDDMESETFEADTTDNSDSGIPYLPTGRSEGGSLSGNLFLDPALAIHKTLLGFLETPAVQSYQLTFADTAGTVWTFDGAGFALAGPKVVLSDGVKSGFKIKISKLPTFPA